MELFNVDGDFREMAVGRHRPNYAELRHDQGVKRSAFLIGKNHFHGDVFRQPDQI